MIIAPALAACFVAVPRTGSLSIARHLEAALGPDRVLFEAEKLHHWHATLEEVEATAELPFSVYNLWSFAVVRNPFDRLVSYCASMHPEAFELTPREVLREQLQRALDGEEDRWMLPQVRMTAGVKQLYRFENFQQAVTQINERFGIETALPHEHLSQRGRYTMYFDSELKALAETLYADDLAAFDYRF